MTTSETTPAETDVSFEQTADGKYRVSVPVDGTRPESISMTLDDTTYTFDGYAGVDSESSVIPDVLLYERCRVSTTNADVTAGDLP